MHPNLKRQPIQLPTLQVHHNPLCDMSRCRGDPGKGRKGGSKKSAAQRSIMSSPLSFFSWDSDQALLMVLFISSSPSE